MLKKSDALLMAVFLLLTLASCSYEQQEITEEYVQTENGYALKRFEGPSTMATFTVKDAVDGTPVTELLEFSIANIWKKSRSGKTSAGLTPGRWRTAPSSKPSMWMKRTLISAR